MNRIYISLIAGLMIFSSCTEKKYFAGDIASIEFSEDTIHFDTVFTTIGTTSRELRVKNPYRSWLLIDRIQLAGGENSPFRLNIDGKTASVVYDTEIAPGDSLFIFIDAVIDPNDRNNPVMINDSIEFEIQSDVLDVNLIAWGQDIRLMNSVSTGTDTWDDRKPWVIYNSVFVDTGQVLTINEGARILFHRGSAMYIAGSLVVKGSNEKPVLFASDRTEEVYSDIPGQWEGIYFLNGSSDNRIHNAEIIQAVTGIHAGDPGKNGGAPDLDLKNLVISHMSVNGLSSIGGSIDAENILISDCGYHCAFLAGGGEYIFNHCTMASRWTYSGRTVPSVFISDYYDHNEIRYTGNLERAGFYNSVITGNKASEVFAGSSGSEQLNIGFINCLVQDEDPQGYSYEQCIFNRDPIFVSWDDYDFRPDTLSPLLNMASGYYAEMVPYDLSGNSRLSDEGPDIGAYEKQADKNN